MEHFKIRVTDLFDHMTYQFIGKFNTMDEAIKRWNQYLFEVFTIPEKCTLRMVMQNPNEMSLDLLDDEGEKLVDGSVEMIVLVARDRDKRLKEIIRMKDIAPPDQLDLAVNEGYELEEIAIAAIEEVE